MYVVSDWNGSRADRLNKYPATEKTIGKHCTIKEFGIENKYVKLKFLDKDLNSTFQNFWYNIDCLIPCNDRLLYRIVDDSAFDTKDMKNVDEEIKEKFKGLFCYIKSSNDVGIDLKTGAIIYDYVLEFVGDLVEIEPYEALKTCLFSSKGVKPVIFDIHNYSPDDYKMFCGMIDVIGTSYKEESLTDEK